MTFSTRGKARLLDSNIIKRSPPSSTIDSNAETFSDYFTFQTQQLLIIKLVQKLTKKDLLLSHRIRSTHYKCARVERHQFESSVGCKIDDFLLCGECVLGAAVTGTEKNAIKKMGAYSSLWGRKEELTLCQDKESARGSWVTRDSAPSRDRLGSLPCAGRFGRRAERTEAWQLPDNWNNKEDWS